MVSAQQQQVNFLYSIDVNEGDRKGNAQKWLLDVQKVMIESLRSITRQALKSYPTTQRVKWVRQWPGQIVLIVNQIIWTSQTQAAITGQATKQRYHALNQNLKGVVNLVRGQLNQQQRLTLGALVVIDVHARDVISSINQKNIKSTTQFQWIAQMRYYFQKDTTLRVKMVNAALKYGYQYIGNSTRLVITPLTDR